MARTSVLLPVPDSPAISTRSPGMMAMSVSSSTAVPSSSVTDRSLAAAAPRLSPSLVRLMRPTPSPLSARSSPSSDTISEAARRADAVQSASRG